MRDLAEVFRSTTLLVLAAMTAALYAIILVLFKPLALIPGVTEMRLAPFVPCLCSFLFGPAAAWGAAMGNLVGDLLGGTLTHGSAFGFLANLFFGYVPYKLWQGLFRERPAEASGAGLFFKAIICSVGASAVCATIVGYGVGILGLFPAAVVTTIVMVNNSVVGGVLSAILLPLLSGRARRLRLSYPQVLRAPAFRPSARDTALAAVVLGASLGGVGVAVAGGASGSTALGLLGACALVSALAALAMSPVRAAAPRRAAVGVEAAAAERAPEGPAVELRGVSFTYEGQRGAAGQPARPALRSVSLTVARGEWVVIMGGSGAGKTTLCRLLNRLIPEEIFGELSGEVRVWGEPVARFAVGDMAAKVGAVFEDFEAQLVASTPELEVALPLESLAVPVEQMRRRVPEVLKLVGFTEPPDRPMDAYSGGERQRLALAAVLAPNPPVLVLDEVTTDLDPAGRATLVRLLGELKARGAAIVMVEHDPELARLADKVVLLHEGEVLAQGPPAEVLGDLPLLRRAGVRPPGPALLLETLGRSERPIEPAEAVRVLSREPAPPPPREVPTPSDEVVLEVRGLSHRYGAKQTLDDVSLVVRRGEQVAIVGQNGSGKTTLAKHFNGLILPQEGEVRVLGRALEEWEGAELGRKVAYVFQNPDHQIFAGTVREEVSFGPRNQGMSGEELRANVARALEAVGLRGREDDDPFALTRGERQRLALASALACAPEILVLDEPTTGLDARQQEGIIALVEKLREQGLTVVFITHAMHWVERCADRVVVLHEGRVVFDGAVLEAFSDEQRLAQWALAQPDLAAIATQLGWGHIPALASGVEQANGGRGQ